MSKSSRAKKPKKGACPSVVYVWSEGDGVEKFLNVSNDMEDVPEGVVGVYELVDVKSLRRKTMLEDPK